MRILCTGAPEAEFKGKRVIVSIPSGGDTLEIELTPNKALTLARRTQAAALAPIEAQADADIIDIEKRRRKAGKRKRRAIG